MNIEQMTTKAIVEAAIDYARDKMRRKYAKPLRAMEAEAAEGALRAVCEFAHVAALSEENQRIAQLETALNNIKRHLEMVAGDMAKSSAAWHIADAALNNKEQGYEKEN